MIWTFPLDFTNDWASYMAQLHFLKVCGFHNFCPYWYSGFITFQTAALGWKFFALPLYLITKNVLSATFISLILLYALGFLFLYILGKVQKLSLIEIIAFFLFFFANPIAIGNFIRLGRIVSLFGFVLFLGFAALIFKYKNCPLDKKFFLYMVPLYGLIFISHQQEMILSSFLLLSLFLIKKNKERIWIILSGLISLLLASFWLVPFVINASKTNVLNYQQSNWLNWSLTPTNLAATLVSLSVFFLFYFYWKGIDKNKRELLFFSPILTLNLLFFLKVISFIPILKHISPDPYILFFLFFSILFLFKIKIRNLKWEKIIWTIVFLVVILSLVISTIKTPYFTKYTELEREVVSIFPFIEGKYAMIWSPDVSSYPKAYFAYGAIYYNLSSIHGWYDQLASSDYLKKLENLYGSYYEKECGDFIRILKDFKTEEVVFYGYDCGKVNTCGLKEKVSKNKVCLYKLT
ncbi:MAG: hypothetical protein CMH64_02925 [Nanoarchaeota archaeon]|nr:hypothetical protein [Nanoarchaeota archaeon]